MSSITLYEDWRTRKEQLTRANAPTWRHLELQRPVLEYLLKRYEGDPAAQKPALFPMPSALILQRRTMIVQHQLAKHMNWHIHDEKDARKKTSAILERMKARNAQESVGTPAQGSNWSKEDLVVNFDWGIFPNLALEEVITELKYGWSVSVSDVKAFETEFSKLHKQEQLRFLNRAYNTLLKEKSSANRHRLLAKFLLTHNPLPEALDYLVMLWQHKFDQESAIITELPWFEYHFYQTMHRGRLLNHMRNALDAANPNVRFAALKWIEKLGGLDDIGLIADLHALPPEALPDDEERAKLMQTMEKLSGLE